VTTVSFAAYVSRGGEGSFTQWLRDSSGDLWDGAVLHRFTKAIGDDVLPEEVFRSYLLQEYAFVETSATVLGYTIAKAPSMREKAKLTQALAGLTTTQEEFFQRAFQHLEVPRSDWDHPVLANPVQAFQDFVVRTAATGAYEEPLTTMLAAEWIYLTWCTAASKTPASGSLVRNWVDLHVASDFEEGVSWLREQLDEIGPQLSSQRQLRLAQLFVRTLDLEIVFHDVPFEAV
jgi:thiaminase/transcriptional activator TenA